MKGYHMASCNSAINQRFLKGAIVSADPENICPGCGAEIRTFEGKGTRPQRVMEYDVELGTAIIKATRATEG